MALSARRRFELCLFVITSLCAAPLTALDVAPFVMPSARLAGLGGTHAALSDDFVALFTNPAGFAGVKEELSLSELSVTVYGPIFDIADTVNSYLADSGSLDISPIVGSNGLSAGLDIGGPLSFGWVGRGLGFGLFNRTTVDAEAPGVTIGATAAEELLLVGGYAFRIISIGGNLFDVGFLGKGFLRGSLTEESSILSVDELFSGNPIETQPFYTTAGIGLDLGIRYEYAKTFAAGIVCHDVYSPALVMEFASTSDFLAGKAATDSGTYATIDPELDVGVSYSPHFTLLDRYVSGLVILLDYRDILDLLELIPRNPILNVSMGLEVVVLDALSLRAGISDALPHLGFGLDLSFMRFDFAMRGIELGLDPGTNPVFAMDLGLLFRY